MKHIITLCLALFFMAGIQNAQAQTKEETISWLKEKLSKYMEHDDVSNISLQSIDECKMVFNYTFAGSRQFQQILPTAITGINSHGKFTYSAQVASDQEQGKEANFSSNSFLQLGEREENISARVEKALKHLATFCPKKKETF